MADDQGLCASCRWHGDLGLNAEGWTEARLCTRPDLRAVGEPDPVGRIVTLPDFGCIQWEAKPVVPSEP